MSNILINMARITVKHSAWGKKNVLHKYHSVYNILFDQKSLLPTQSTNMLGLWFMKMTHFYLEYHQLKPLGEELAEENFHCSGIVKSIWGVAQAKGNQANSCGKKWYLSWWKDSGRECEKTCWVHLLLWSMESDWWEWLHNNVKTSREWDYVSSNSNMEK